MSKMRIKFAEVFATFAHKGQKRKYTGEPYINHPKSVAYMVAKCPNATENMVIAALLHDVVEDTWVKEWMIGMLFGVEVEDFVSWLTDTTIKANRATRKEVDRMRLSMAPSQVQTIKLADLIDNTSSIIENDPKFAKLYLKEKEALLEVMKRGDDTLREIAWLIVDNGCDLLNKKGESVEKE